MKKQKLIVSQSIVPENQYGPEFNQFFLDYCKNRFIPIDKISSEEFDLICDKYDEERKKKNDI